MDTEKCRLIFSVMALFNFFVVGTLVIIAPWLINLLWGGEYLASIVPFRILCAAYFFLGTFRMFSTNILAALNRLNFNLALGIISGIFNIVMDYFMISRWADIGAAVATLLTVVLNSAISIPYLISVVTRNANTTE